MQGVSRWLFVGQVAASSGFVVYSWLLANWVFVVTNMLMIATAILGQWVYLRNKRHGGTPSRRARKSKTEKGPTK